MKIKLRHIILLLLLSCNDYKDTEKDIKINNDTIPTKTQTEELEIDKYDILLNKFFSEIRKRGYYTDTNYIKKIVFYTELKNKHTELIYNNYGYYTEINNVFYNFEKEYELKKDRVFSDIKKIDTVKAFYFRKKLDKGDDLVHDFLIEEIIINDTIYKKVFFNDTVQESV